MGVSLLPSDAESGGLFNNCLVRIDDMRFEIFDWKGKAPKSWTCKAILTELTDDALEDGESHEHYWSVGSLDRYSVSDDGFELEPQRGQKGINSGCNFFHFLQSVVELGFSTDLIAESNGSVEIFHGMIFRCYRKPVQRENMPDRPGAPGAGQGGDENQRRRPDDALVASEIIEFPYEDEAATKKAAKPAAKKAAKKPAAKKVTKKAAPVEDTDDDDDADTASDYDPMAVESALDVLPGILDEDGAIGRSEVAKTLFRAMGKAKTKAVYKTAMSEAFTSNAGLDAIAEYASENGLGELAYDDDNVTWVAAEE